jgi:hypothetical protein
MQSPPIEYATPQTRPDLPLSAALFLCTGLIVVACIPAIFFFDKMGWPGGLVPFIQFIACIPCFLSATAHVLLARHTRPRICGIPTRGLAVVAAILCGGYLLLIVALLASFAVSDRD